MKRKLFISSSSLTMNVLLLTFVITSCTKKTNDLKQTDNPEEFATAPNVSSAALSTYSLAVTVNSGFGISGDVFGSIYTNNSQNVSAIIDKNGNFVFNTNTKSNLTPTRTLNFNFTPSPTPALINSKNYTLETVASTLLSFTPLQNLSYPGGSECVSFRVLAISGNTIDWRAVYHAGFDDRDTSTTAFGLVTRSDATHWTITSTGTCLPGTIADKMANRAGNANILYGFYSLPFSLTLTKL